MIVITYGFGVSAYLRSGDLFAPLQRHELGKAVIYGSYVHDEHLRIHHRHEYGGVLNSILFMERTDVVLCASGHEHPAAREPDNVPAGLFKNVRAKRTRVNMVSTVGTK